MSFTTHKYTRPVITSEVRKLSNKSFTSATSLAAAMSPRAGTKSAKFAALTRYVGGRKVLNSIFSVISNQQSKRKLLSLLK